MFQRPLAPICAALILGILAADLTGGARVAAAAGGAGLAAVAWKVCGFRRGALLAAAACLGAIRYACWARLPQTDVSRFAPGAVDLAGRVVTVESSGGGEVAKGPGAERLLLQCDRIGRSEGAQLQQSWRICTGQAEITIAGGPSAVNRRIPEEGDLLTVEGDLELPPGRRNPGGPDRRTLLARRGITALLYSKGRFHAVARGHPGYQPLPLLHRLHAVLIQRIHGSYPPLQAGLLAGILLGDRTGMSQELQQQFQKTGASHILATAGLHVGLACAMILFLLRAAGLSRAGRYALTAAFLPVYAILAG
ncbi:MAG TPA: ComEC/Rec2 family competence protein [Chthonomonadales bacterium]|nr:ComEC/Rec2 family competence protein [Chthonomonadales bacterium]